MRANCYSTALLLKSVIGFSANLITAGKLAYAPASGVFGAPLASFDFGLMDNGGFDDGGGTPYSESTYTFSFTRSDSSGHAPVNNLPAGAIRERGYRPCVLKRQ